MATVLGALLAGFIVLALGALAIYMGHRMVMNPPDNAGAIGDGLGPLTDIFNPLGADAKKNLKEYEAKIEIAPSPDDEDTMKIDLNSGKVRIKRPH